MSERPHNDPGLQDVRVPPYSEDAERSVLGAVMLDNRCFDEVQSVIEPDDFYRESHRHLFRAMGTLSARKEAIDTVTLAEQLKTEGLLEVIGGASTIARLTSEVPSAAHVQHHATIVQRKSALRAFIKAADGLIDEAYADVPDVEAFMDGAEQSLFQITQRGAQRPYSDIREIVKDAFTQIEAQYQKKEDITGVASGFVDLDHITAGWQPSDLIILAARPAMGKTAITLNMVAHAAVDRNRPTAFFSLEMANQQLAIRMLCSLARVDQSRLRTGNMGEAEWHRLIKAAGTLSKAPIMLDDTPALSIMEFRSKCRRMKAERNVELIFVDYLQLMRGSSQSRSGSREQEISEISRNLKAVAKELDVPIIALAQLNRGVESRADKRPMMSDLRESGAIEQDADIICFLYRDEVYNVDTERKGIAELIIGKHRNGALGTVDLRFFPSFTRFENLANDDR